MPQRGVVKRLMVANPLERLNKEVKRGAQVGIFRNDDAISRLVGALLL